MEQNLTYILDALKQGVILLDDAGAVLYCNQPLRGLFCFAHTARSGKAEMVELEGRRSQCKMKH